MSYSAGFDFSSANAVFAVVDSQKGVIFDRAFPFPGRDASALPSKMNDILLENDLVFEEISDWSIGIGPGSFTGLRIAAAFAAGLTFRKNVRTRGVSSAVALAHTIYEPEAPVLALYDGRKKEILACGLKAENGHFTEDGYRTVIHSKSELADAVKSYPRLAALEADKAAIEEVCTGWGPLIGFAECIFAATMVAWNPQDYSHPVTDLTYLRPAVFVPPSAIRNV